MLHDLTRWVLYSPTRLVSIAAVVVAVTTVAWTGLAPEKDLPEASPSRPAAPSAQVSTPEPTASHLVHEGSGASRAITNAARRFLAQYVVPPSAQTPKATPLGLQALATPSLWKGLRLTDPDALPRGVVRSVELETAGPYSGTVLAKLDHGPELRISVVAWQRGWRIGDVRPAEDS